MMPAKRTPRKNPSSGTSAERLRILALDIGGSGLKAAVVDKDGRFLAPKTRIDTPARRSPRAVIAAIGELVAGLPRWNRISIGFPGFVKDGRVVTAPNFGTKAWHGFALRDALSRKFHAPAVLMNDADTQGFAVIAGKGLELVITLGTGFGTAIFRDGEVMPHLEIAHIPIRRGLTYDDYLGDKARRKIGDKHWNKRVERVIPILHTLLNYDRLLIGGGNAKRLTVKLPKNVRIVSNEAGLEGGAALWHKLNTRSLKARRRGTR